VLTDLLVVSLTEKVNLSTFHKPSAWTRSAWRSCTRCASRTTSSAPQRTSTWGSCPVWCLVLLAGLLAVLFALDENEMTGVLQSSRLADPLAFSAKILCATSFTVLKALEMCCFCQKKVTNTCRSGSSSFRRFYLPTYLFWPVSRVHNQYEVIPYTLSWRPRNELGSRG